MTIDLSLDIVTHDGVSDPALARDAAATISSSATAARTPIDGGDGIDTRASEPEYVRSWSRVWFWPVPPDTYVDPAVVRVYLAEEARRGGHPGAWPLP